MQISRQLSEIIDKSKKSVLLLGPRQTGKSTLIKALKPELTINLADQETYVQFLRDPGLLNKMMGKNKKIFIDEVQRIPSLLNTIQTLIDDNKALKFFLTGSSARKLKRGQANLLPGRVLNYELGPLCAGELKDDLDIGRLMVRGALPGAYCETDEKLALKTLRSYSSTYLKEEVQAEALTRNLEGFSRFFDVIASRSGDFVDFAKFSSQAMIERTSARRFVEVMVDTLILHPVEPFTKSSKRRLVQHSRYYFFDVGALNGALGNFQASVDRRGNLFEHLCLQMVLSEAKALDQDIRVSVYRTEAGAEVDFIVETNSELFAVEVKATRKVGGHDLRGLKSFQNFYGKRTKQIVIYLGEQKLIDDGVHILPLADAIKMIFSI